MERFVRLIRETPRCVNWNRIPKRYRRWAPLAAFFLLLNIVAACVAPNSMVAALPSCLTGFGGTTVHGGGLQTKAVLRDSQVHFWIDIGVTGVFTPSTSPVATLPLPTVAGYLRPLQLSLDDFADKGYVALRVPNLGAQASRVETPTLTLNYYSPPDAPARTSATITATRWVTYEADVSSRFGTDSQSHWEVWRVPPGERVPLQSGPYRLKDELPPPIAIEFGIDFGPGTNGRDAIGRQVAYAVNNGYLFIGPMQTAITARE